MSEVLPSPRGPSGASAFPHEPAHAASRPPPALAHPHVHAQGPSTTEGRRRRRGGERERTAIVGGRGNRRSRDCSPGWRPRLTRLPSQALRPRVQSGRSMRPLSCSLGPLPSPRLQLRRGARDWGRPVGGSGEASAASSDGGAEGGSREGQGPWSAGREPEGVSEVREATEIGGGHSVVFDVVCPSLRCSESLVGRTGGGVINGVGPLRL